VFLSFDQKRKIFKSFPELSEKIISNGRVNYIFEGSMQDKKVLARELSYTGNGYVYGGYLPEYKTEVDARGWINIRDYNEKALKELILKVIESFK